jgi:hypothetical protein
MLSFKPHYGARLGQRVSDFASGFTTGMAKDIVREAEPPVRRIIQEERHRFATAVIDGLPFFGLATLAYVGTRYFVPEEKKTAKGVGYIAAAAAATVGGWYTVHQLRGTPVAEEAPAPGEPTPGSQTLTTVAQNTAKAIVEEAEPRIRQIVDEERARIAEAGQIFLPFAVGSVATFLATLFLVSGENNVMKAIGYTGSALLMGIGLWTGLEKEKAV